MLFFLANIVVLALAAWASWWLSGYDAKLTGENERRDFIRRAIRVGTTLVLVELAFLSLWRFWRYGDQASGMAYLIIALPLALLWVGCLGELCAHTFHRLIDPEDHREFDPLKSRRDLDMLARLVRNGRKEEAIQLCQMLKESGDVSVATLDTMLEHLGVKPDNVLKPKPLTEAYQLRSQGKLSEAEAKLNSLLMENPANVDAALMLMRLYAQDLHRSDKASEVLRSLELQPNIAHAHIEFARRSIYEWSHPTAKEAVGEAQPESLDELLANGYFGTAIEILEQKVKEQPQDFDLWLKLAETQARHCGNIHQAEKIIQRLEANPAFSPEQIQLAGTRLKEWREARLQHR
ncbi:MAG TPA: tetratricopeptide repeat protein [Candidatus Limnocylindrales bacterium]|nr:tetratricopeptide repeat protein [Candidatus Limnocylindrales bacterium]